MERKGGVTTIDSVQAAMTGSQCCHRVTEVLKALFVSWVTAFSVEFFCQSQIVNPVATNSTAPMIVTFDSSWITMPSRVTRTS